MNFARSKRQGLLNNGQRHLHALAVNVNLKPKGFIFVISNNGGKSMADAVDGCRQLQLLAFINGATPKEFDFWPMNYSHEKPNVGDNRRGPVCRTTSG